MCIRDSTGGLDKRPPVRGICSVAAEVTAAVKLRTSSIFPQMFLGGQEVLKPVQSA